MEKELRILEITKPNGNKRYIIQKRRFIFRWLWVDMKYPMHAMEFSTVREYYSLEEAKADLCLFAGTKDKFKEVYKTRCK